MNHSYKIIALVVVLGVALGFAFANVASPPQAVAQQEEQSGRPSFQISAFGDGVAESARFGAYVINTATGKVWLIREGGDATPIGDNIR